MNGDWLHSGGIQFENVWIKYRDELPHVLKGLSFTIEPCQKIGVVGRTGSGKSTILLALLRVLEANKGKIRIDGQDIKQLDLPDLRKRLSLISQEPTLFEGTLRENLDLEGQHNDNQLWNVLDKTGLRETFVNRQGLNTQIIERGENLSAGEKQLVCLARAFLKKSPILLLDEATSSIDLKTE